MMQIRPIIHDDQKQLARMLSTKQIFNDQEVAVALEIIEQVLQQPEKDDYTILCACLEPNIVVGYICFGPVPLTEGSYDLYWILVDKKFSRRGIGTELLLGMEEILVGKNARRIYIDTSSTPLYKPAREFYEKSGFWVDAVLEDFYRPGDDKIIYLKVI